MDNFYFFLFTQHFDRDKGLDHGRLSLNHLKRGTVEIWVATSSVANKQQAESFHSKGGLLPPQYRVKNLPFWEVATAPISMPQTKGVEGSFYQIEPFSVVTDKGGTRGDFGIHRDANVPGSQGCIVMNSDRFALFEKRMAAIRKEGIDMIPLFVQYS